MSTNTNATNENTSNKNLYRLAGLAALSVILVGFVDIGMTFLPGSASPKAGAVVEWFELYHASVFYGLRGLGLFNIFTTSLAVILFFALHQAHRQTNRTLASFALIVMVLGSAVYIANNRALPMLSLSGQYYNAGSRVEKDIITAAGMGMLAQGEDFTPGTFVGFTLVETAGVIMSLVLLNGKIFGRGTSITCLAGYALLIIYSSLVCFQPSNLEPLMPISIIGGLLSMAAFFLIALRLFRLSNAEQESN
ncbi:MAG: hypothetical protein AB9891_03580 [Anaerolineaceae bacterium]